MLLNAEKTKIMLITTRQKLDLFNLTYNDVNLQLTTRDKILGVNVDQNLQWTNHVQYLCKKISSIWLLSVFIHPHFNYCNYCKLWGISSNYNVSQLTKLQRRVCKIARRRLNILSFDQNVNKANIMYKVVLICSPNIVKDFFSYERTRYLKPHYDLSRIRIFISPNLI